MISALKRTAKFIEAARAAELIIGKKRILSTFGAKPFLTMRQKLGELLQYPGEQTQMLAGHFKKLGEHSCLPDEHLRLPGQHLCLPGELFKMLGEIFGFLG